MGREVEDTGCEARCCDFRAAWEEENITTPADIRARHCDDESAIPLADNQQSRLWGEDDGGDELFSTFVASATFSLFNGTVRHSDGRSSPKNSGSPTSEPDASPHLPRFGLTCGVQTGAARQSSLPAYPQILPCPGKCVCACASHHGFLTRRLRFPRKAPTASAKDDSPTEAVVRFRTQVSSETRVPSPSRRRPAPAPSVGRGVRG